MTAYKQLLGLLPASPRTWLITGVAGFIGSNLLETLLKHDQRVVGLDNFATGHQHNLDEVETLVTAEQWGRFYFIEGDIRSLADCQRVCSNVEIVLHQAALGSVPRSIEDPLTTNAANIDGFLNMLVAARIRASGASSTPPAARPTVTIPACPSRKTSSAARSRPTRSPSMSMSSMPLSSPVPTESRASDCVISTYSDHDRIPMAPMPPSFPNGPPP